MKKIALALALLVAACGTPRDVKQEKSVRLKQASFSELKSWDKDNSRRALLSFQRSCEKMLQTSIQESETAVYVDYDALRDICRDMPRNINNVSNAEAKKFFEDNFAVFQVEDVLTGSSGLFTGYYQPFLYGSKYKTSLYSAPIYARPVDLATRVPYYTRKEIADGVLNGKAKILYWTDPVDLFHLQVQGSGILILTDGTKVELGYDGNNGHAFKGAGGILIEEGIRPTGGYTAQSVKSWYKGNRYQGEKLLLKNPRYIFYKENKEGPYGSQGVVLTAQRSLAVDTDYIPLGVPIFLETNVLGAEFNKLMVAQDTGAKIKGAVRGDVYWGTGSNALKYAGTMKNAGKYYVLLPKASGNKKLILSSR